MKITEMRGMSPEHCRFAGGSSRNSQSERRGHHRPAHEPCGPLSAANSSAANSSAANSDDGIGWSKIIRNVLTQMLMPDQRTLDLHEWMSL